MAKKSEQLNKAAMIALKDYLALSAEETLLVITDERMNEIGRALFEAGMEISAESFMVEMKERSHHGEEPPEQISEMMKEVDVVVAPTSKSLTHTDARRKATQAGVRIATMPGISKDTLIRCLSADYKQIVELTEKVEKLLEPAKEVFIETKLGTEILLVRNKRKLIPSTGVLRTIGSSGNLPSGEVFFAPIEDMSNGRFVIDGSIAGLGLCEEPVKVSFKNGYATRISGGRQAKELSNMLNEVDKDSRQLCEFGIGTNYKAQVTGDILEDEKALGTVHFAFGNNISMGGKIDVPIHIDCVITKPTVYADRRLIMKEGKLRLD